MNTNAPQMNLVHVTLHLDNGAEMQFSGRPFAGGTWYNEEAGLKTTQKMYLTDSGEQVFVILTEQDGKQSCRGYRVSLDGETCTINDGKTEMSLSLDMLMLAVRTLAGVECDSESMDLIEETLRSASC